MTHQHSTLFPPRSHSCCLYHAIGAGRRESDLFLKYDLVFGTAACRWLGPGDEGGKDTCPQTLSSQDHRDRPPLQFVPEPAGSRKPGGSAGLRLCAPAAPLLCVLVLLVRGAAPQSRPMSPGGPVDVWKLLPRRATVASPPAWQWVHRKARESIARPRVPGVLCSHPGLALGSSPLKSEGTSAPRRGSEPDVHLGSAAGR